MKMVRHLVWIVSAVNKTPDNWCTISRCCLLLASLWLALFSMVVKADQFAVQLPDLFDQLLKADSSSKARDIESQIWQHWLQAPDKSSEYLLSQVSQAMGAKQLDLALKLSTQLIDGSPDFSEAWNKRATIHYLLGDNRASVSDIRETLALEPRHFGAISGLGLIFMREKNMEAAVAAFEQVLAISPASDNAQSSADMAREQLGREI